MAIRATTRPPTNFTLTGAGGFVFGKASGICTFESQLDTNLACECAGVRVVKPVSLTRVSGRYSGRFYTYDPASDTYTAGDPVWIRELNWGTLRLQYYLGFATETADGRCVYVVACCEAPTIPPPPPNECDLCDTTPPDVYFILTGITNDVCTDCTTLNTTWNMSATGECTWQSDEFTLCDDTVRWHLGTDGSTWQLTLVGGNTFYAAYSADTWDCTDCIELTRASSLPWCNLPDTITVCVGTRYLLTGAGGVELEGAAALGGVPFTLTGSGGIRLGGSATISFAGSSCDACASSCSSFIFTLSGVTDGAGHDCENQNGPHQLDAQSNCIWSEDTSFGGAATTWRLRYTQPLIGPGTVDLVLLPITVSYGLTTVWDCQSSLTLLLQSSDGDCNWPASVTIECGTGTNPCPCEGDDGVGPLEFILQAGGGDFNGTCAECYKVASCGSPYPACETYGADTGVNYQLNSSSLYGSCFWYVDLASFAAGSSATVCGEQLWAVLRWDETDTIWILEFGFSAEPTDLVVIATYTATSWDCQSDLTLDYFSDDGTCQNWQSTITIRRV